MGLKRSIAIALTGIALSLSACGSAGGAGPTSTTVSTKLVLDKNGTVTIAVPELPTNFNPSTVAGSTPVTTMVMSAVWPQAFVLNNYNQPQCRESVSGVCVGFLTGNNPVELVSNHPQTIVYHVAAAAKWSDGTPIGVADFIYNWKMQLQMGGVLPASDPITGYEDIKSIRGSSHGKDVTVVFKHPYADWTALFSNLVPAHVAKNLAGWNHDFAGFHPGKLVSGGPFEISSYDPGHTLVLRRNPHYWGPRAGVASIVLKVVTNQRVVLQGLAQGTIDMATIRPSPRVDNTVALSSDLAESVQPGSTMYQLDFNLANATVSNLDLRQAIAEAIDRHQIVSNTIGTLTPFNNVAANHIFPYGFRGSQPNDSTYEPANLAQATIQLDQAGYTMGADGLARDAAGHPLDLTLTGPNGNSLVLHIEEEIQAQLLQIGIQVAIRNVSLTTLLRSRMPAGRYEIAIAPYFMSWYLSTDVQLYSDPVSPVPQGPLPSPSTTSTPITQLPPTTRAAYESSVAAGVVTRNVLGLDDPSIAQLFADASQELNAGSVNTYNQADTAIWAVLPALPLFQVPVSFVYNLRVLNVANSQGWLGPMWNAQNWRIQRNPPPTTTTTTPS